MLEQLIHGDDDYHAVEGLTQAEDTGKGCAGDESVP